jgi:protein-tyrosine phosphatase
MDHIRARQVRPEDFRVFDRVFAMDRSNLRDLERLRPADGGAELGLFLPLAPHLGEDETPDPYYGEEDGFERVLDLLEAASDALVERLGGTL